MTYIHPIPPCPFYPPDSLLVFVFLSLFTHALLFCHPFTVVLPVFLCFCLPRRPTWPISAGAANLNEGPSRSLLLVSPVFHYGFFQFSQSIYQAHQGLPVYPVDLLRVCPWNWRPHHHLIFRSFSTWKMGRDTMHLVSSFRPTHFFVFILFAFHIPSTCKCGS